jgi:hypothetical protein
LLVVVVVLGLGTLVPPGTSEVRPEPTSGASYLCSFYLTVVPCSIVDMWVACLTLMLGNYDGVLLWLVSVPRYIGTSEVWGWIGELCCLSDFCALNCWVALEICWIWRIS